MAEIGDAVSGTEVACKPVKRDDVSGGGDNIVNDDGEKQLFVVKKPFVVHARIVLRTREADFAEGAIKMLIPKKAGLTKTIHSAVKSKDMARRYVDTFRRL